MQTFDVVVFYALMFAKRSRVYRLLLDRLSTGPASEETLRREVDLSLKESLHSYLEDLRVGGFIAINEQNEFVITDAGRDSLAWAKRAGGARGD